MLRSPNHLLDPESSPSKAEQRRYAPESPSGSDRSDQNEDEWFSSSSSNAGAAAFGPGLSHRGNGGYTGSSSSGNGGFYMGGVTSGVNSAPRYQGGGGVGPSDYGMMGGGVSSFGDDDDDDNDDIPLLEELGINFDHIFRKTMIVLFPNRRISEDIADDTDLAGPLCFALILGSCLLLKGKVHFGYIYGFSVFGSLAFNTVLGLLHHRQLSFWLTASVLGYCLLPVTFLSGLSVILSMRGILGMLLSVGTVFWSTFSAIRMLDAKLKLLDQFWLVVYPLFLVYSCFTLITIF